MAITTIDNPKGKKLEMISLKHTIIVGFLVSVVIAFCLAIAVPSVKATPSLTLSANGYYDSSSQHYYFIGEVKNVGSTPATDITIRIIAYDTSNNQVDIETPTPEISILNAGAKSPFDALCEDSAASLKITHFDATIYSSSDSSSLPVGIQVTALNATLNGQSSFITGTLQNTGASETDITNVFTTYYNSTGAVVGIATDQTDVLEPNDTSDFNTTSGNMGTYYIMPSASISGYTITAESWENSQAMYTMTESNGGTTIPEFSTVSAILLLLAVPPLILISSKKAKRPKFQFS